MNYNIRWRPQPVEGETILFDSKSVKAITGKALPSYRITFWIPGLLRSRMVITERRIIIRGYMLGFLIQEFWMWYAGAAHLDDPEVIQFATAGGNWMGKYLEIHSHHPRRLKYLNWLCSPHVRLRFWGIGQNPIAILSVLKRYGVPTPTTDLN